jgi:CelD/BcsL family acetyltransferase involved in cellulose biosynthesis
MTQPFTLSRDAAPRRRAQDLAGDEGAAGFACACVRADDLRLQAEWRALAQDAAEANAFEEPWFVRPGLAHLAGGRDIRLIAVRDGSGLTGLIPLTVVPRLGRLPIAHVQNWRHHHDFLGTPLVRKGREAEFWGALLDFLDGSGWAAGLLHINGLVEDGPVHRGLQAAAARRSRACPVVHRERRAALASTLSPKAYYEQAVRKKKRKEIGRLQKRLAELGTVTARTLGADEPAGPWCEAFLALEQSSWKGREGSALASQPHSAAFLRAVLDGAQAAGRLQIRSLELDGRPIAMLINFLTPPGSFSFKIAYDENYARFSPGVLLQIENLDLLDRAEIDWMDSCAAENHSMIDSLWMERRSIVRLSVRLSGLRRGAAYAGCRTIERLWAGAKQVVGRGR